MTTLIKKGSGQRTIVLAALFVLIAALLMPVTSMAFSMDRMQRGAGNSLNGEIVAVDNTSHLTILTVQSDEIGRFPNNQMNVFLNPYTTVKICAASEPAKDAQVNREATISYHEAQGLAVADSVREHC